MHNSLQSVDKDQYFVSVFVATPYSRLLYIYFCQLKGHCLSSAQYLISHKMATVFGWEDWSLLYNFLDTCQHCQLDGVHGVYVTLQKHPVKKN
jgi:hypothetical protein